MQLERDQAKTEKQRQDVARMLDDELRSEHTFLFRLKKALEMLGRKDLADLTENDKSAPVPLAGRGRRTPPPERMRDSLKNYEKLVLAAQQRVGIVQPSTERAAALSEFSGPPSVLTADLHADKDGQLKVTPLPQLRRDEFGRPQAPAENSAHLGKSLFTDYLLPVELGGFLLLIAAVGAIAIAHRLQTGRAP